MTTEKWTVEVQENNKTVWKTAHVKQGNATIAIVDDLICGDNDAVELANEIALLHNMAEELNEKAKALGVTNDG